MAWFPTSPTDGQQANVGNITYQWSAATGAWNRVGTTVPTLLDGLTVAISGNLAVNGNGLSVFQGPIQAFGNISATGNVIGQSFDTAGTVSSTGNVTGGNLISLGSISAVGSITAFNGTFTGAISTTGGIVSTGNITAGNVLGLNTIRASTLSSTGNITVSGNIFGGGQITAPGNITGSNLVATTQVYAPLVSAVGNVIAGSNIVAQTGAISAAGNIISGQFFVGNGSLLTGISTGGVSLGTRANVIANSGTIANAITANASFVAYPGYALYKVTTSVAAWVRVYSNVAARTADAARTQFNDPLPSAGVIAEVITSGANIVLISPAAVGFNDENPVSNVIPVAITNLSGSSADVGVTFTVVQLEV